MGDKRRCAYRVEEWTIENFSCWRVENHDLAITPSRSQSYPDFTTELYPRGLGGTGDRLLLRLCCNRPVAFAGDLRLEDSEGTLLWSKQVDSNGEVSSLELPPGPKFDDVTRKLKDRLVLRYRIRRPTETTVFRRTRIEVFEATFRLSHRVFEDLEPTFKRISSLKYPCDDGDFGQVSLEAARSQVAKQPRVLLSLQSYSSNRCLTAETRVSVVVGSLVVRTEENERLFSGSAEWTFSDSLSVKEIADNRYSLVLTVRIIPTCKYKQGFGFFQSWNSANVDVMPAVDGRHQSDYSSE